MSERVDLGPERVSELLASVLTTGIGVTDKAADALTVLFCEGTKLDALAFVGGCLYAIRNALPPGVQAELAVGRYDSDGEVQIVDRDPADYFPEAVVLAGRCIQDFLAGDHEAVWEHWLEVDETTAAATLGVLLRQASDLMRSANARLN